MDRRVTITLSAVGIHLLAHFPHGYAHELADVGLTQVQLVVVPGVVLLGPLLAVGLLLRGYRRWGSTLLMLTGVLAFGVEGAWHFLLPNPDYVLHVHEAQFAFGTTAVLLLLADAVVVIAGMSVWRDE